MFEMAAVKLFFKSPLFRYGLAILIAFVVVGYAGYRVYTAGETHIQMKWDLEKAETAKQIAELKLKANKVTIVKEIEYRDRIKKVKIKGDVIVQTVTKVITKEADSKCPIPNNFVLLHDLAVRNELPLDLKLDSVLTLPTSAPTIGASTK